jgi:citrate synthase
MVARTRSALTEEMTVGTGPGVDASAQAGGLAGLAGPEHGDGTPTPRRRLQAAAAVDR